MAKWAVPYIAVHDRSLRVLLQASGVCVPNDVEFRKQRYWIFTHVFRIPRRYLSSPGRATGHLFNNRFSTDGKSVSLHATAPSLKVQTVERVLEYLAHYAPYVDGVARVVGCNRSLALPFPRCVPRNRTLDAFVSRMAVKCGGRERMPVAFGDFSRSPDGPVQGHACALVGLALARRMRRQHGLAVVFTLEFNTSQGLRAQTGTNPLGVRRGDPGPAPPAALRRPRPPLAPRPQRRPQHPDRRLVRGRRPPETARLPTAAPRRSDGGKGEGATTPRRRRNDGASTPATPGSSAAEASLPLRVRCQTAKGIDEG